MLPALGVMIGHFYKSYYFLVQYLGGSRMAEEGQECCVRGIERIPLRRYNEGNTAAHIARLLTEETQILRLMNTFSQAKYTWCVREVDGE